jgi:MFS family permease
MTTTEPESNAEVWSSSASESRSTRGFWALIATQFQGAYSDNILRNLLLSMIVGMGLATDERETLISLVTLLFSVPFIFFSMAGGWLADHYSKRHRRNFRWRLPNRKRLVFQPASAELSRFDRSGTNHRRTLLRMAI